LATVDTAAAIDTSGRASSAADTDVGENSITASQTTAALPTKPVTGRPPNNRDNSDGAARRHRTPAEARIAI
jgi:hypothetical protein